MAGRDMTLVAAEILNNAPTAAGVPVVTTTGQGGANATLPSGSTVLGAGGNLTLGTVTESTEHSIVWNKVPLARQADGSTTTELPLIGLQKGNYREDSRSSELGTTVQSSGALTVQSGGNLSARAATLVSNTGAVDLVAEGKLTLSAGENTLMVVVADRIWSHELR